jgi:uncharacterized membrane protein (DUF106 family)
MAGPFDFLYSGWNAVVSALSSVLGPAKVYPYDLITILLVCATMSIISAAATRALVDVETMRRRMTEVREWQSAYSKAIRAKDQKQIDKLKKKEQAVKNATAANSKDQIKPLIVTLVPFWIFYGIFSGVFGYNSIKVGYTPIALPFIGTYFVFWTFYFVCSFGLTGLIQRIFNLPTVFD